MSTNREQAWAELEVHLGEHGGEITAALRELYAHFTRDMLTWAATLYDPASGGFYYSTSAVKAEGYGPDIESTYDFFSLLYHTGAMGREEPFAETLHRCVPQWLGDRVAEYLLALQAEDGYFYNFQWSKESHTLPRLGRDLGSARTLLRAFGRTPRYELHSPVTDEGKKSVPARFHSAEVFRSFLGEQDITHRSYAAISHVLTQVPQIREYGRALGVDLMAITMEWLTDNIRADNGLWQPEVNYYSVNGLHKATRFFNAEQKVIPYIERGIRSAMEVILSDEVPGGVVDVYNPWHVLSDTTHNMRSFGSDAQKAAEREIMRELHAMAPAGIRRSTAKLMDFSTPEGAFSYCRGHSSATNQGMPSAIPGSWEADANGNGCAVIGLVPSIFGALDAAEFFVPIFDGEDLAYVWTELERRR